MSIAATTDDPGYTGPAVRMYDRFLELGMENAASRVYLGVHWAFDCAAGYANGYEIGEYVAEHEYAAVPEPATVSMLLLGISAVAWRRRRR